MSYNSLTGPDKNAPKLNRRGEPPRARCKNAFISAWANQEAGLLYIPVHDMHLYKFAQSLERVKLMLQPRDVRVHHQPMMRWERLAPAPAVLMTLHDLLLEAMLEIVLRPMPVLPGASASLLSSLPPPAFALLRTRRVEGDLRQLERTATRPSG